MKTVTIAGKVLISDVLDALFAGPHEDEIPDRLERRRDERIECDDIEVVANVAVDALDDADELPEPEELTYTLDERTVLGLAEAIRCGDIAQAESHLDRLFADTAEYAEIREWIDRGRYSMKARKAKAAHVRPPRGHTAAVYGERKVA